MIDRKTSITVSANRKYLIAAILTISLIYLFALSGPALAGGANELVWDPPKQVLRQYSGLNNLRAIMKGAVSGSRYPGVGLLVAHKGNVIFYEAYGLADREAKKPMTTDSVVCVASVTKTVAATCLTALAEDGKISLDDPVSMYLPAFAEMGLDGTSMKIPGPVIRQLLSNTAGLYTLDDAETPTQKSALLSFHIPLSKSVEMIGREKLKSMPGSKFAYSDPGFQVAGRIVEVVTGQPFEEYLAARVTGPLGMKDTKFRITADQEPRKTIVYDKNNQKMKMWLFQDDSKRRVPLILVYAGLRSTLRDLAIFSQMHLNGGVYGPTRVLSPQSVREMQKRHTPANDRNYGLGWFRTDMDSDTGRANKVYHTGVFGSRIWIDFDRDLIGVIITNTMTWSRGRLHNNIIDAVDKIVPARSSAGY